MTRLKRRILISVLALAGLAALLIPLHNFRARQALAAHKAELVAQGEKLTVEELMPPSSPEARRAANDLMQAAWQLRQGSVVPNNLPKAMVFVSPGKASVGWRQSGIRDDKKTNTWDELAEDVNMNGAALEQIRETLKTPQFDMNLNYKMGFNLLLPHVAKLKSVAQWLSAATENDLHAGRLNEAATNLNTLISLANAFREERLIISQLVRMAITAIAISPAWESLQADGWTDAQLAELQKNWESLEFLQPMEHALEMERAMGIEAFERLRNSDAERRQFFNGNFLGGGSGSPGPATPASIAEVPEFALEWSKEHLSSLSTFAGETAWLRLWSYDDELRYVQTLQAMLEVPRRARRAQSFISAQAWGAKEYQRIWEHDDSGSPRYWLSRLLGPALEKASAKAVRIETQRELVVTAIALKRHQLRHGRLPPDLKSMVPEYLSQTPKDFMDGRELRYRPNADVGFLLYSVNEDGQDDGGDATMPKDRQGRPNLINGRDMVWPMPATAQEAAEAEAKGPKGDSNRLMLERYGLKPK
ncbi:MAG: hypothetical protein DME21_16375 [Verrucomicrobia bacterium]|nr:MAG: hypothetical protein DME21_16375 [Verrucomicrobiota bacterium]